MQKLLPALLCAFLLFSSCSQKPEELIEGWWSFDHAESTQFTKEQLSEFNSAYSAMHYEFDNGKYTCDPGNGYEPTEGTYRFENDRFVILESANSSDRIEIAKLDDHTFVMLSQGASLVLVRNRP